MSTPAPDTNLRFEDLAVGQVYRSARRVVTREEMAEFAARYDPQPFHLSDDGARGSIFGTMASTGWLTAAVTMRLTVEALPVEGGFLGTGGEIAWPRPLRPGDEVRVEAEIVDLRRSTSRPGLGILKVHSRTLNQNDEEVQVFHTTLMIGGGNS